jgi:hypothetical protein
MVDEYEMLMSEIQLRAIVQNMDKQGADQQTDGDEIMVKFGATISKFSREALEVESKVGSQILGKVRKIFDLNKGDDSVFCTKNGHRRSSRNLRISHIFMSCFQNMQIAQKGCQLSRP